MLKTYIIAEAGVNHNGDISLALQLIDAAYSAGADAVKFQTFNANKLVTAHAKQADYQLTNTKKEESQLNMLKRLELSYESHKMLISYCEKLGIEFMSTAFDNESLEFLVSDLKLKNLKIASGEITNAPLLLQHARTNCNLILSTGMASLSEIENALAVIAFGFLNEKDINPSIDAFHSAYYSPAGQNALKEKVTLLHCTTEYPAPIDDINLKAIDTLSSAFKLPVGYSDHSEGIIIPIAAVSRGAIIIEKHFTLDKNMEGPDHKASLEPDELSSMIKAIRAVEKALGNGIKGPQPSEIKNKLVARKSIIAARMIKEGQIISTDDLIIKRPGTGMSPYSYWNLINKASKNSYNPGDIINE
ncbi:N-acetylneuraminate synthase [Xenorhabdus bovienii]|uniref:N-acetylneuraminate synthase n=1 Tax=Xenorhabdus bovienii TaxID=40576 RepID=UPI001EE0B711|nr:N-acetylneuraminate synthase [Xenorhabdus bovienii]MCG3470216.1 N-acetylneuraminate synthase [Xenorhabdus bovienii]